MINYWQKNLIQHETQAFFQAERKMAILKFFLLLTCHLMIIHTTSGAGEDKIDASHPIKDGQTVVSSNGRYELGFFSPGRSTNRYVGMWFKTVPNRTVIWVANREAPLPNKSGVLKVTEPGILVLLNETNGTVWSTNTSRPVNNPIAQLLDSGNFVVRDGGGNYDYLWQSFDYPTDTLLASMKLGRNLVTGVDTYLSSWKSDDDPAPGAYIYYVDLAGYPQIYVKKNGVVQTRLGPWNGQRFKGTREPVTDPSARVVMVMNQYEVSFRVEPGNTSVISIMLTLTQTGVARRLTWIERTQEWSIYLSTPADDCDQYRLCGSFGICDIGASPLCGCLDRFEPRYPQNWGSADWSGGCVRKANLSCQGDGFLKYSGLKLPDARNSEHREGLSLEECRAECLRNCSCTAYSVLNMSSRSGCLFWFDHNLIDMRKVGPEGLFVYIRMPASELESADGKRQILIGCLASAIGMTLLVLTIFLYLRRRKRKKKTTKDEGHTSKHQDSELPFFDYSDILQATHHFSHQNKLGEGGFGPVYKGILKDGQEIAVKCLSRTSTQGIDEFKNEVNFIAKLQHRNLVRLLGSSIQENQNMLIYEYMHHRSLDVVLFDKKIKVLLDWPKRFHIINGIARGILYLHQDSRLRIIHRDLKASNILLDSDFNAKISDFGTARCFGENETATKTRRVVGTYGYMSPEYAVDGLFSMKSDVFSFGVIVLEIVSGKKNREFAHSDHYLNLLGHAWALYNEERALELVDPSLGGLFDTHEVLKSMHVGLLCVQKKLDDRPKMSSVVLMLGGEGLLPSPKQPGFFIEREITNGQSLTNTTSSMNEVTVTTVEGR